MPAVNCKSSSDETLEKLRLLCVSEHPLKTVKKKTLVSKFQDTLKNQSRCEGLPLIVRKVVKQNLLGKTVIELCCPSLKDGS